MHFQGRVTPTRPYKWIFRDGQGGDPPLKMDLQGQVGGVDPPLQKIFPPIIFQI